MRYKTVTMPESRHIALVAHDNKKADLLAWSQRHKSQLASHHLYATGTTGELLNQQLGLAVHPLMSGPLGGDQQIGAMIAESRLDTLIFFWDPLSSQPHDPDVKALLRLAAVWNIPVACNASSADFIVSSPLFNQPFERIVPDYEAYQRERALSADT